MGLALATADAHALVILMSRLPDDNRSGTKQLEHDAIDPARRAAHHCHASGCAVHTAPDLLMCRKHWYMVPRPLQLAVWRTYRRGQCEDMNPSSAWHTAADAAIGAVALKERKTLTANQGLALEAMGYPPAKWAELAGRVV